MELVVYYTIKIYQRVQLKVTLSVTDGERNLTYPNGDFYDGHFQAGKRWGNGTMKYANGDNYTGYWKNNLKDGNGKNKQTAQTKS